MGGRRFAGQLRTTRVRCDGGLGRAMQARAPGRRIAHEQFRLAGFEIMKQWRTMAGENDDRPAVDEAAIVWT